jgi:hypothetical protein
MFGGFGGYVYQAEAVRVCDVCLFKGLTVSAVGPQINGLDLCEIHLEAALRKAALRKAALREAALREAAREAVHLDAALREAALYDMFAPAYGYGTGTTTWVVTESAHPRAIRCNHCDGRGQCTEMTTSKSGRCKLHKRKTK